MTGRQTRGEATIERVLDATLACAVESGIHDVSIEAVCKRSKVSVGSLYHHFPDRHGLVFALYRRCLESMLEATVRATVVHRDPETGVKALVSAYLRWVETHRDEARIIYGVAEGDLLESYRDELAALGARVVRPLVEWLAPFVASRHIIAMSPALLEVVLIGPAAEAARRILGGASGLSFRHARAVLPEIAWRSVAQKKVVTQRERVPSGENRSSQKTGAKPNTSSPQGVAATLADESTPRTTLA